MAFAARRGRPKKTTPDGPDLGTPELQRRHRRQETAEPIDRLTANGTLDANEYWCALHFRWLYTLRYGTVTPASLDPARIKGMLHKKIYLQWQQDREQEWKTAVTLLEQEQLFSTLLNICIHNQAPHSESDLRRLINGLQILCTLWCKTG